MEVVRWDGESMRPFCSSLISLPSLPPEPGMGGTKGIHLSSLRGRSQRSMGESRRIDKNAELFFPDNFGSQPNFYVKMKAVK